MRVAIVGVGAMGGVFGARLAEAGNEVLLVDVSPAVVESIGENGVLLSENGDERSVRVDITVDPTRHEPFDFVVFFVKSYSTAAALELAKPLIDGDTTVVSLQNGWGNGETIASRVDPTQLILGVTYHSAIVTAPGKVNHTSEGPTYIGPLVEGSRGRAAAFAETLRSTGFNVEVSDEVRKLIWIKLILNAVTLPISALTRLPFEGLTAPETMVDLVNGVATEAIAVANASGLEIDLEQQLAAIHNALRHAGRGKASMLQDVEAGRRTEIDVINGAVVREAKRVGVDVPVNEVLYALVRGLEAGLRPS